MKAPDRELRHLVDAWHDATITPAECQRLEERLSSDREARRYFFEIAAIESSLAPAAAASLSDVPLPSATRSRSGWWRVAVIFFFGLFSGALGMK